MAKKGKDEAEEEYEFTPPDFDEEAFIHREISSFRATLIFVPWAVVVALISWLVYSQTGGGDRAWYMGLALCAGGGYMLKFILPKMGADTAHYKRKEWFGTGFMFFMAWLAIFILLVNPPVTDIAPPQVDIVASPAVQVAGDDVLITVFARDNGALADVEIDVLREGTMAYTTSDFEEGTHGRYTLMAQGLSAGTYEVHVTAHDTHDNPVDASHDFTVGARPATFNVPDGGLDAVTDKVEVVFPSDLGACSFSRKSQGWRDVPCVRSVVLHADQGGPILMVAEDNVWTADIRQEGWIMGATHNVTAEAHFGSIYVGKQSVEGGKLRLGPREVHVSEGVLPDGSEPEVAEHPPDLQQPPLRSIPGPGALLVVGVLLVGAAVVRRR